jgi:hypothetical protein
MTRPFLTMILACGVLGPACGDDAMGDGTAGTSTGGATTTVAETDPSTSTSPGTSTGPLPGTSGSSDTAMADSTGTSTGPMETETDSGAGVDCDAILPGPLAVETVFVAGTVFAGTEDIAFDGQGNMAGKNGGEVRLVAPDGRVTASLPDPGPAYGLRYRASGQLLAAKYQIGEIRIIDDGSALVTMAGGVNGLWPDLEGNVWFTNFSSVRRINADDSVDVVVTGAEANTANGVILDPDRSLLYYTNYGQGTVRAVPIAGDGTAGAAVLVASIPGAAPDGLNLDACGNLYVVDQGNAALYRVWLDEAGGPIGAPELLVEQFPSNVANAVWGQGPGWEPTSLYAAGVPGGIHRVEIGVPGLPSTPAP